MPDVTVDLPHEGETLSEAVTDIETRYGVTLTVVQEEPAIVQVAASDYETLITALRGACSYDDADLEALGLL